MPLLRASMGLANSTACSLNISLPDVGLKLLRVSEETGFVSMIVKHNGVALPHTHIGAQDKNFGLYQNKYSLVYYLETGDQTGESPGILTLYNPDEKILPANGMIIIFNSEKLHSVSYLGNKDRVMVGVNLYGL